MNIRYFRRAAKMTQEELGDLLGWSAANVSAAERSADGSRERRRFDAGTLANIAFALRVPLTALFLPPADHSPARQYLIPALPGDPDAGGYDMHFMLTYLVLPDSGEHTDVMDAYRERFASIAGSLLDDQGAREVARILRELEGAERRAVRAERLRARSAELLRAAEELTDLADAIDPESDDDER